jgi:hypothetical protein
MEHTSLTLVTYSKSFCVLVDGKCEQQPTRSRLTGRRIYIFNLKGTGGESKGVERRDGTRHWSRNSRALTVKVLKPDSVAWMLASAAIGAFGDI